MEVDPAWTPELEGALTQRIEGAGGLNPEISFIGYALSQVYASSDRPDDSASMLLELVKVGGEGPVSTLEVFDAVNRYPQSEVTDAAIVELCPLVRPQVESVASFMSSCVGRAGGDISKLSWEGVLADLDVYARSSYAHGPAQGTFTFHSKVKSYKRSFWALGYIENTSAVYIGNPKVTAVLLDKDGAELGSYSGYAMIDEVGPGVRAPVSILVNDPPKYESVRYEFVAEQADYLPEPVPGLRVEPIKPRHDRFGWKTEGKVISEAEKPAAFVKIVVQALDADGQLVGAQSTYADGDTLAPGGTARWSASSMDVARKPDHFEYMVTARVAD